MKKTQTPSEFPSRTQTGVSETSEVRMRTKVETGTVRVAAVGDLHCTVASHGVFQGLFGQMAKSADVLVLCGDLTDYGLPEEAQVLAGELKGASGTPIVAVLGNHDFESERQDEVKKVLLDAGVHVLDGGIYEFRGVGFAGVKGFFGGFDDHMLQAWGEQMTKLLVHEAMEEALKLETALARLETSSNVVLMHYAPIKATVEGEKAEIFPFLGSSRLEEPLHRHPVNDVFHGHAHHGTSEGQTSDGAPVYNVALPLLRHAIPEGPPFRTVTLKVNNGQ